MIGYYYSSVKFTHKYQKKKKKRETSKALVVLDIPDYKH